MDEVEQKSMMDDLKQQSLDTAKDLAPWRAGLPWWVVLVEGAVLGVIGILILIDPRQTTVNVALFLAAALVIAGIIQLWSILRGKVPESVDSLLAARGAIGIYAGGIVLLLFFLQYLSMEAGLISFGLGSLIYGILGLWSSIASSSRRRLSAIIEGIFFTAFGVLLLYVLFAGGETVQQVTSIVGWTAIVGGLLLIGISFYNRSRDADREESQTTAADTTTELAPARQRAQQSAAATDEATSEPQAGGIRSALDEATGPEDESDEKPAAPSGP
jgi:uncharacterized membrane protein HdeD (DUF308 family)